MSEAEAFTTSTADDWPAKAATTVVGYVDKVRGSTTGKALVISRAVVYLLAAALLGIVVLLLTLVLLVRLLVSLSASIGLTDTGEVWTAYLVLGVIFSLVGMFLWRKKGA